jgi:hypothetical protein
MGFKFSEDTTDIRMPWQGGKIMAAISSKAWGTFHVNDSDLHDATMVLPTAAFSMKGISMSIEQNVEGDEKVIRRFSTVSIERSKRAVSPHLSLLTFEKEPQAHIRDSWSGRLGRLRRQSFRLPPKHQHWDLMHYQKRAVLACRCSC